MQILNAFLQSAQLVQFSGSLTFNSNGFAVLPSYTIIWIPASMQPIKKGELKFLPEGTHYADWLWAFTNYPVYVDYSPSSLGNYFIYNNNVVYKITSDQNFNTFPMMPTTHIETLICKDNRLTYNGTTVSLPAPEIDGKYAPLFELITMVNQCFTSPTLTTLWAFQQELQPAFPYCTVTLEAIENIDNTNHVYLDVASTTQTTNISNQLVVKFSFYALDQIQALNLMQQFKLNYVNFTFSTNQFGFIGFMDGSNEIEEKLYEDRTIFNADCRIRFSYIVQQTSTSTQSINDVIFTLSIPPVL